jgi:hypothetical protein
MLALFPSFFVRELVSGLFAWVAGVVALYARSHFGFVETDRQKLSECI